MFDMGFEPQIARLVQNVRPDRQTVLFSATFPRQVETLARKVLTRPVEIQVGGKGEGEEEGWVWRGWLWRCGGVVGVGGGEEWMTGVEVFVEVLLLWISFECGNDGCGYLALEQGEGHVKNEAENKHNCHFS